jgi:hypothetical protein
MHPSNAFLAVSGFLFLVLWAGMMTAARLGLFN